MATFLTPIQLPKTNALAHRTSPFEYDTPAKIDHITSDPGYSNHSWAT